LRDQEATIDIHVLTSDKIKVMKF